MPDTIHPNYMICNGCFYADDNCELTPGCPRCLQLKRPPTAEEQKAVEEAYYAV